MGLDQARCEEMLPYTREHAAPNSCLATNHDNRGYTYGTVGLGQARSNMTKDTG